MATSDRPAKAVTIKMLGEHAKDCRAMASVRRGDWDSPWYFTGKLESRDKIGRKNNGWTRWLVLGCNATNCTASCLVSEDWILKGIPNE